MRIQGVDRSFSARTAKRDSIQVRKSRGGADLEQRSTLRTLDDVGRYVCAIIMAFER